MSNRLPLTQQDFQNNVNSLLTPASSQNKLASLSPTRLCSDYTKSEVHLDVQPAVRAVSPRGTATSTSNSLKATPEKSSIQKKTIRKLRDSDESETKKKKFWSKLHQTQRSQGRKADDYTVKDGSVNMTYKFTPKKKLSQLITPEERMMDGLKLPYFEEKETTASSPCISNRDDLQSKLLVEDERMKALKESRDVCFLNKVSSDVAKMNFSGLNVFIEEDEDSFTFPVNRKTTKFVV